MTNNTRNIRFPAIFAGSLLLLSALAGTAEAQSQTSTGFEHQAAQSALTQYAPRFAAIANTLTACDLTQSGVATSSNATAICSTRLYLGDPANWEAYHSTVKMTCTSGQPCIIEGINS